jgi:bifunctional non-homologous end joining protein LigD
VIERRRDAAQASGAVGVKSKCLHEQELVIGGFTCQPKHPGTLGALLMGYYEKDTLVFAGKVGTGFSQAEGRVLLAALRDQKRSASPFRSLPAVVQIVGAFHRSPQPAHSN